MSEKPILFSGEMVRAILEGRKTQTRRVVKPQPEHGLMPCMWSDSGWALAAVPNEYGGQGCTCQKVTAPYGNIGDLLWVRETWASHIILDGERPSEFTEKQQGGRLWFKADQWMHEEGQGRWRPSIHMPRWASRITLRVTDVRVERVQDISADDARTEGICLDTWKLHQSYDGTISMSLAAVQEFRSLWNSINAKRGYGWDVNPWVWVVEFEVVK